jgi:signal transduction histidine kinase/DNA-binding response OmpR family regulator
VLTAAAHFDQAGQHFVDRSGVQLNARIFLSGRTDAPEAPLGLDAGGEMGVLVRSFDWSRTPLGPSERWSPSLKMMVSFLLANRFPLLLWWGPDYISIYNDAYRPILGTKHPKALGQPVRECWSEIWHILQPLIDSPFHGGASTWIEDLGLELRRHEFSEEAHFTVAYSPVPDESAPRGIGGVLATVHEITEKVIGERRIAALRDLGARTAEAKSAEDACLLVAEQLAQTPKDVPFALLYLLQQGGKVARLVAATAPYTEEAFGPRLVELGADATRSDVWSLSAAVTGPSILTIDNVPARVRSIPPGPWTDPPSRAVVLPLRSHTAQLAGVMVAGVSSRLQLDPQYATFFELVASQIATAIGNARAYEEERKRAEALATLDRAKTTFFSNVSHEFRTPLTLMLGPVEEAAGNAATPPHVRAQLELAHRNALRLLKLVNSLLDFARIEAGRMQASYEPTDLAQLTHDLASTFRSAIERAGLCFTVECEDLAEPVYVDREMYEKVVLNLLSNALKFTLRGGIAVRLRRESSAAVLAVTDTGVGVPEHELPRLFERFHRVEGTMGRTQEGSGIGLALVHELVKLHGGSIEPRSQLARGSTFEVRLPFGAAHLAAEHIKAPRTLSSTAIGARAFVQEALRWIPQSADARAELLPPVIEPLSASHRFAKTAGARIVLADDNADMREYVRDLLSPLYRIEAVPDGERALQAARHTRPDLILCDIMMPRVDGLAVLKALRADESLREVPVVLLSARAGEEARLEGLDAGADDYLVKPFSARELLARIGALLELTRMRRENEERFRAFLRATSDVIYRMSPDWGEMRQLWGGNGGPDTDDPTRDWLDRYIPREDQPRVMAAIHAAIRTKTVLQLEHRVRRADGTLGWVFSRAIPVQNVAGDILEWFGADSDITVRKQAEKVLLEREEALRQAHADAVQARLLAEDSNRRLRASEEALREADQRKTEFLALLGHELRNPLSPISTAAELLSRGLADGSHAQLPLEVIKRQTAQLTRLVDDLLDVARITQGRIQLQSRPLELASVIAQAIETVQPQLREKHHQFSVIGGYEPLYVSGDYARLVQCVVNVLGNAAKYTAPHGQIRIETRAEESSAIIEIADTGPGISPELLPRLFEMFVQGERTLDRSQGGLGIGLSVVKRLLEMHGGDVTARSDGLGHGSTFEIRLPRIARPVAHNPSATSIKSAPRRVLIVDDNTDAANSLAMLLTLGGHDARVSYSGQQALEKVEWFQPEVALLDIGLPGIDGYELARRLRAESRLNGIRLVALTGYGQLEDRQRAQAAGFDDHLVKPVDLSALEHVLAHLPNAVPS